jgi:hypothetical protein
MAQVERAQSKERLWKTENPKSCTQVGISTLGLDGILYLLGVRDREAMDQEASRSARL